jgi:hypothetical protein
MQLTRWFAGSLVAAVLAVGAAAAHADVWGYVDEHGAAHVADRQVDERYRLFFRGPAEPSRTDIAGDTSVADAALQALRQTRVFQRVVAHPNVSKFEPLIEREAISSGLEPALVKAVIAVESSFEPTAVSPKGALGLMQVIPGTGARYGVTADRRRSAEQKLLDPSINVRAGTRYLRDLLAMFDGNRTLALAAYNAGEDAVQRYGRRVPPYPETRDYVKLVEQFYAFYTPPAAVPPKRVQGTLPPRRNVPDLSRTAAARLPQDGATVD